MTAYRLQRPFDFTCAALGLVLLSPCLIALAVLIALLDGTPVFFRQVRVGRNGRPFRIWKFRTMRTGAAGSAITSLGDERITTIGKLLRKYKLDEMPQLINVLCGDMSMVGPRPEVPEYVDLEALVWRIVLQARPGITDVASLTYREEEKLLGTRADFDTFYRRDVQPAKLALNLRYLESRSLWTDIRLILLTVRHSFFPGTAFAREDQHETLIHPISLPVDR